MFFEASLLVMVVYLVFCFLFYKVVVDFEFITAYECGFDPYSQTRATFSYRFFLISILFIIFDVEISLMLPVPYLMESVMSMWIFIYFIGVLVLGLLYEYSNGALEWLESSVSKA